jgi:hypothetical protein
MNGQSQDLNQLPKRLETDEEILINLADKNQIFTSPVDQKLLTAKKQ